MTKILVPVDGSDASLRALRRAMKIADEVLVVNVQLTPDAPSLLLHMTSDEIAREQLENGASRIAGACAILNEARHRYTTSVLMGAPAIKIVEFAQSEGVDEIVMGARGMGPPGNAVLGSTANRVLQLANVPVSVIE